MGRLLGLREASERLGLEQSWLRRQAMSGKLKAIKVGRDWLVDEGDLEEYARAKGRADRSGPPSDSDVDSNR